MNEWNKEQLKKAIKEMDVIQARFYMDNIGNEVANILNEAQSQLQEIYDYNYGEEN